ncbi:ribosome rescue GTPase HflX [Pantoea sp. Mhis]|uniref:ribosome rescue GTPase HflX n=1 Tax=Pantoea sp. Mhis TaxID=2576759 RepID=UPI001356CD41|nr:ribosome rescue GTPase HflX [Pantoea sp. Mhis]MXP56380.1 GTPase HflX [Pantoea sp. Mhis]
MFNGYNFGEQAVLVHICFSQNKHVEDLQEFKNLAISADLKILQLITGKCNIPNPKYLVGKGKAAEITDAVKTNKASVILFNHVLNPSQERNLEKLCGCPVIDRTKLILHIFSQRARTHEGQLQVELAQLRYLATRLVRGWTHLERQKGGVNLRGPGETQLEIDRRLLRIRINYISSRLKQVEKQREQSRHIRAKANVPTIGLVGYTNSGKSSIFNAITHSNVYTADRLFATLDPTLRRLKITDVGEVVLADTVGFIRHLPHDLIMAFKATLQETCQAILLLHVIDAVNPYFMDNIAVVNQVLTNIKASKIPTLLIMNKIDMLKDCNPRIERNATNQQPIRVWLSAKTGIGLPLLWQALYELLLGKIVQYNLRLPPSCGRLRSYLYKLEAIKKEYYESDGSIFLQIQMSIIDWQRLCKQELLLINYII